VEDGGMTIVPMEAAHYPEVARIHAAGIATGNATFESEPPPWEVFDARRLPTHRWVAVEGAAVLGWTAVTPVSVREVYAGVVEHAVYVDPAARGRGVGRALLDALVASTEAAGIWTVQSGIFPENSASLALHAAAGFRVVGTRERVARMSYGPFAGRWRDVVLVERRSAVVGAVDGVGTMAG
jgi:L-amino acid N-acyltransferase YncA